MDEIIKKKIEKTVGIVIKGQLEVVQSLWSGYGEIVRYLVDGADFNRIIVKHVKFPNSSNHPRGWNTDFSHQRKLKSYEVETAWYEKYSSQCDDSCRIPKCYHVETSKDEVLIVLEDLNESGFDLRKTSVSINDMHVCLTWLANFHAAFLMKKSDGLWNVGTYWHLDTRPDELEVMDDPLLKEAAPLVDNKLNSAKYLSLVHGDAKLANFCFSVNNSVAAVDFQYVGGGCGMKDVAYFIGSCIYEEECKQYEEPLLNHYFAALKEALKGDNSHIDFNELEKEWRALYPYAWTDFHRFLKGWSPDHWKINSYSERMARKVIKELDIKL